MEEFRVEFDPDPDPYKLLEIRIREAQKSRILQVRIRNTGQNAVNLLLHFPCLKYFLRHWWKCKREWETEIA